MDNFIEIHDGDFYLKLYLDNLYTFPAVSFRRVMRLLKKQHPEELARVRAYLQESVSICKAEWDERSKEYTNGWRLVNPRSRSALALEILAENKRLTENLQQAKRLYETYNRLLQICENQGGTST